MNRNEFNYANNVKRFQNFSLININVASFPITALNYLVSSINTLGPWFASTWGHRVSCLAHFRGPILKTLLFFLSTSWKLIYA